MSGFSGIGIHYYAVDEKGRLMIPAPFREIISKLNYSTKLYITRALFDPCLVIYPFEEWSKLEEKVRTQPRMDKDVRLFNRCVIASAQECSIDKQGRILIPPVLREYAGINGEVAVVGQVDVIELWNKKEWNNATDITSIDREATEGRLVTLGL